MPQATGAALVGKATEELIRLSVDGIISLTIRNKSASSRLVAYYRDSAGVARLRVGDSKVSAEPLDGNSDSLGSLPCSPGSLRLTHSSSALVLKDRDGDGLLYRETAVGTKLANGTNGVTSVPATRTLTSAAQTFSTKGVLPGDKVVIASSADAGVYTVVAVTSNTVLTLDRNFPVGSKTSLSYAVYAQEQQVGTINYFTGAVTLSLPSSGDVPGQKATLVGTNSFPINLSAGALIAINVNGAGASNATFDAASAVVESQGATMAAASSETLTITLDDGVDQVVTFGSESTAALYAAAIAAQTLGIDSAEATNSLNAMIGILNDLKVQYEAHRVLTAGGVHGAADSTNVVTAADATDLATAITLANDLKVQYEAHRVLTAGSVHDGADGTNTIAASNASDLSSLVTLTNELKTDYEAHRVLTAGPVHAAADSVNAVTAVNTTVVITSDKKGTGASVTIAGGAAILAKLGLSAGTTSGTGDVADIDAVTFSEFKTVVEADVSNVSVTLDEVADSARINNTAAPNGGSSTLAISAGSVQDAVGLSTSSVTGLTSPTSLLSAAYIQSAFISANATVTHRVMAPGEGELSVRFASESSPAQVELS